MSDPTEDSEMPEEIDFSQGRREIHHIPKQAEVFLPVSIERGVWEYFAQKAESKGISLSDLLTEVLRRNIVTSESLE